MSPPDSETAPTVEAETASTSTTDQGADIHSVAPPSDNVRDESRSASRWPHNVALAPDRLKRAVIEALEAGCDDEEIAETTGLDVEQVAAIRDAVLF